MKKFVILGFATLLCIFTFLLVMQLHNQNKIAKDNICTNENLVAELISNNINPFTKFKYIKKRNSDCEMLLKENREEALASKKQEFCPILEASANSLTFLVLTYINEMYDRETASKEMKAMLKLMPPYEYCPEYIPNMINLIKLKRKFGLL